MMPISAVWSRTSNPFSIRFTFHYTRTATTSAEHRFLHLLLAVATINGEFAEEVLTQAVGFGKWSITLYY
jgi:hypothetical protein